MYAVFLFGVLAACIWLDIMLFLKKKGDTMRLELDVPLTETFKKDLQRVEDAIVSNSYVVLLSGRTVSIYNHQLTLLQKLGGFSYVYRGAISPDERLLLCVANDNVFHLVSLADFSVSKHRVRKPYTGSLEGRGCFARDGAGVYLPVQNDENLLSTLRYYPLHDLAAFTDFLDLQYWIVHVQNTQGAYRSYLAVGLDRGTNQWNLIWWSERDGTDAEVYAIKGFDDVILDVEVCKDGKVCLYGAFSAVVCDVHGALIKQTKTELF